MLPLLLAVPALCEPRADQADLARFPAREDVAAAVEFNRAWRSNLEWWQHLDRPDRWQLYADAIAESERLYWCWYWLHEARSWDGEDWYGECHPLFALGELRRLIGDEAYEAGRMPPCVPLEWFGASE